MAKRPRRKRQDQFENSSLSARGYSLRGGQGEDQIFVGDGKTSLTESFINLNRDNVTMKLLSASSSTIYGGAGGDTLSTGKLHYVLFNSNRGNDTVTIGGATSSSIFGGAGNDNTSLRGDYVNSLIQGDNNNDTITLLDSASLINATINSNSGDDTITTDAISSFERSTLFGGQGDDTINASSATTGVVINGNEDHDFLRGSELTDTIIGAEGNDEVRAQGGNDSIDGGSGNDEIFGNEGNDWIDAGNDDDAVVAGQGNDTVNGGLGNDRIRGGTTGADQLNGGEGNDTITGYSEADIITGGSGSDTFGNSESLFGISGSSVVASANTLTGAGIIAGDTITFATTFAGNVDRVLDFSIGVDQLDVVAAATFPTLLVGLTPGTSLTLGTTYVAYGNYNTSTGEFVIAAGYSLATPDALLLIGNGTQTAITSTGYQVLTGLAGALTASDFI